MKRLLLCSSFLLGLTVSASATVILDPHLSGTGDNVTFESLVNNVAKATFNGQHPGFADFTDLSGNPAFTGAANGNDIKISNTSDLQVQVFNDDGTDLGTTTQVFSLKGTGDVIASIFAFNKFGVAEGAQIFDLGTIDPHAQSGFTFSTIDGEVMDRMVLLDKGGTITDYEHYRIDTAPIPSAVPLPAALPLFGAGLAGLGLLGRYRRSRAA